MIVDEAGYVLDHSGVKGMKWGVRRDPTTGVRPIAKTLDSSRFGKAANANAQRSMNRSRNRQLNKESAKKDWAKQEKDVAKARATVKSGKLKEDRREAKAQFKQDKIDLGSREARKILAKKREKINSTAMKAQEAKNKKETAIILTAVGAITLVNVARLVALSKQV